tara:strand:- start:3017 stop:4090 length:1074 start_codon:yes stop_codon:yes gene_type:complete
MLNKNRKITKFSDAINKALNFSMKNDKNLMCYGLGVTDPKGVFGTTLGLEKKYGSKRVFDIPTSENAITGISIGASLDGVRSVVTHQRLDFFLLALDQLINSASKYHYMFGSKISVPITIRLIVGRGWGQGPTHSQNLHSIFSHIPGLKVVMPTKPQDAYNLLIASIFDPNPVIFIEHRWLHGVMGNVNFNNKIKKIYGSKIIKKGKDLTIISMSYMTIEALHAAKFLKKYYKIDAEVIDLISANPFYWSNIKKSLNKTKKLLVVDPGFTKGSISSDIISNLLINNFSLFSCPPKRLAMPDIPEPTSFGLTKNFYIRSKNIVEEVIKMFKLKKDKKINILNEPKLHDIPGDWFKGPF